MSGRWSKPTSFLVMTGGCAGIERTAIVEDCTAALVGAFFNHNTDLEAARDL
jgi:hypothetical protein